MLLHVSIAITLLEIQWLLLFSKNVRSGNVQRIELQLDRDDINNLQRNYR